MRARRKNQNRKKVSLKIFHRLTYNPVQRKMMNRLSKKTKTTRNAKRKTKAVIKADKAKRILTSHKLIKVIKEDQTQRILTSHKAIKVITSYDPVMIKVKMIKVKMIKVVIKVVIKVKKAIKLTTKMIQKQKAQKQKAQKQQNSWVSNVTKMIQKMIKKAHVTSQN